MEFPEATSPLDDQLLTRRQLMQRTAVAIGSLFVTGAAEYFYSREEDQPGGPIKGRITMEQREVINKVDLLREGTWNYLAGAKLVGNELELQPTGLSIINKRENNRIDPNPPLNIYGTRLAATGDFAVNVRIESSTPVAFQLYGAVPLRFDDFRYERARLECTNKGNTLAVRVWDGLRQEPSLVQEFSFDGSRTDRTLEVQRIGDDLVFVMNRKQLGTIGNSSVFRSGEVWFGMNSEAGNATIKSLTAKPLNGHRLKTIDTLTMRVSQPLPDGLQRSVRKQGFRIGAAVALNPLVSDARYAQLFLGDEVGSFTTENALKPQDVQPLEGLFTFEEGDALVQIARRQGIAIHGHTLVYDKADPEAGATPEWMRELRYNTEADKQHVRNVLVTHIKTVVGHYKGNITSWDVVNEALEGFNGEVKLRENIWFKALGEEYLDIAFHAAHEADPAAELYINDYGLETNPQGRGQFMIGLVQRLLTRGVPIHGVGIEGHVYELPRDTINPKILQQEMQLFNRLGLKVRVSELDVTETKGYEAQARQYAEVLQVCLRAPKCSGLTLWGLDDGHGSTASLSNNQLVPGNALLYTPDYRPKLARRYMFNLLRSFWKWWII